MNARCRSTPPNPQRSDRRAMRTRRRASQILIIYRDIVAAADVAPA